MSLLLVEWLRGLALWVGLPTLGWMLWRGVWRGLRQPPGLQVGVGAHWLHPAYLLPLAVAWLAVCVALW